MTFITLMVLALVLLAFVIFSKPNMVMAIMCSGMFVVLLWFVLNNPFASMAADSTGNNIFVMVLMLGILAPIMITIFRQQSERRQTRQQMYEQRIKSGDLSQIETISRGRTNNEGELTESEYKMLIHSKLHRRRER